MAWSCGFGTLWSQEGIASPGLSAVFLCGHFVCFFLEERVDAAERTPSGSSSRASCLEAAAVWPFHTSGFPADNMERPSWFLFNLAHLFLPSGHLSSAHQASPPLLRKKTQINHLSPAGWPGKLTPRQSLLCRGQPRGRCWGRVCGGRGDAGVGKRDAPAVLRA